MIYVPSKGRSKKSATIKNLKNYGCTFKVVVEPQEFLEYKKNYFLTDNEMLVLKESHKGITYVRNCILEHAKKNNIPHFWMMDDDISKLGEIESGKNKHKSFKYVLESATEQLLTIKNLAIGALEYRQIRLELQ